MFSAADASLHRLSLHRAHQNTVCCSGFKIRTKVTPRGIRTRNLSIRSATRCHCARGARHLGRTSTAKLAYLNSGKLADGDSFCFWNNARILGWIVMVSIWVVHVSFWINRKMDCCRIKPQRCTLLFGTHHHGWLWGHAGLHALVKVEIGRSRQTSILARLDWKNDPS